jgi:hypothetical protein
MGYRMEQRETSFRIPAGKLPKAAVAIRKLHGGETITDSSGRHFSWVDHNFHTLTDPKDVFRAWRWDIFLDNEGNVDGIEFCGEKLGDDLVMFEAIAPHVEPESYIVMHGEDGYIWRWYFNNGKVDEQDGHITWK